MKAAYLFSKINLKIFFSQFQIANAASYGAKAALLYSDPADYALEGGDPQDTYPNKAWLPASGVQRGSLFTMAGSGDPQTPGIAALEGMYRRPQNESELPPIPAHPMGYGDAIHFLKRIGGKVSVYSSFRSFRFTNYEIENSDLLLTQALSPTSVLHRHSSWASLPCVIRVWSQLLISASTSLRAG